MQKRKFIGLIFILINVFLCLVNTQNLFYHLDSHSLTFNKTFSNHTTYSYFNGTASSSSTQQTSAQGTGFNGASASGGSGSGSGSSSAVYTSTNLTDTVTRLTCSADWELLFVSDMLGAAFRTWLPIVAISVLNVLTIRVLLKSKRKLKLTDLKKENQYTVTLFAMNILLVVLSLPLSIAYIMTNLFRFFPDSSTSDYLARLNFFFSISLSLAYLYQSLTFFVVLLFNMHFRRELLKLLALVFKKSDLVSTSISSSHSQSALDLTAPGTTTTATATKSTATKKCQVNPKPNKQNKISSAFKLGEKFRKQHQHQQQISSIISISNNNNNTETK